MAVYPERLALNILFEAITENVVSVAILKGGGLFGHTAFCMSPAKYATIQHSVSFLMVTAPGELTFVTGDTAVGWEDTKLLYNKRVYDYELETNITTALKNIIMAKIETASYIVLKQ